MCGWWTSVIAIRQMNGDVAEVAPESILGFYTQDGPEVPPMRRVFRIVLPEGATGSFRLADNADSAELMALAAKSLPDFRG